MKMGLLVGTFIPAAVRSSSTSTLAGHRWALPHHPHPLPALPCQPHLGHKRAGVTPRGKVAQRVRASLLPRKVNIFVCLGPDIVFLRSCSGLSGVETEFLSQYPVAFVPCPAMILGPHLPTTGLCPGLPQPYSCVKVGSYQENQQL